MGFGINLETLRILDFGRDGVPAERRRNFGCHYQERLTAKPDMGNIVELPVVTRLNLDADRTLENLSGKLEGFILAGYDKDGNEFFSSTYADGGDALWLLERCKLALLNQEG